MGCGGGSSGDNEVKETANEIALAKVSVEENARYEQVYAPLFKSLSKDIMGIGKAEKNAVAGMVNAGVTKTYDAAEAQTRKNMASRGIDPSGSAVTMGDIGREKSTALAAGEVKGQSQVDNIKVGGMQNLVNMARGGAGEAVQGLGSIAADEVQSANQKAYYDQQSRNDNMEMAASIAGSGLAVAKNSNWWQGKTSGNLAPSTTPKPWVNPNG